MHHMGNKGAEFLTKHVIAEFMLRFYYCAASQSDSSNKHFKLSDAQDVASDAALASSRGISLKRNR